MPYAVIAQVWENKYNEAAAKITQLENKIKQMSPCDACMYDPPSSCDSKPCSMCPASKKIVDSEE